MKILIKEVRKLYSCFRIKGLGGGGRGKWSVSLRQRRGREGWKVKGVMCGDEYLKGFTKVKRKERKGGGYI